MYQRLLWVNTSHLMFSLSCNIGEISVTAGVYLTFTTCVIIWKTVGHIEPQKVYVHMRTADKITVKGACLCCLPAFR